MNVDEATKQTTFTVILNFVPKKLITEIYFNSAALLDVVIKLDNYGYIPCPKLTIQYDITRLLTAPLQYDSIDMPSIATGTLKYTHIKIVPIELQETIDISGFVQAPSLRYTAIVIKNADCTENMNPLQISSATLDYKKVTDKPI